MLQDLRFALRQLLKAPGFTTVALLTLGLGIGVNSAILSLVNAAILRPVISLRPDEVVNVFTARKDANRDYRQFSHREFEALRSSHDVFSDVAALQFALAGVGPRDQMRRSFAFLISENFLSLTGAKPAVGRFFTAEEARPNANQPVVVASYSFWRRLGGRADLIGSTVEINGQPYTLIGVTPEGFSGVNALIAPEIWLPLGMHSQLSSAFSDDTRMRDLAEPKNYALNLIARLAPGLTVETAKPRLPVVAKRLTEIQPSDTPGDREIQIQSPSRFSISTTPSDDGPMGLMATLLLSMAGAVLLIACLNLANMLLARGTARANEMAVRMAVGASRWRIVRQLLCEGILLSLAGGALGLLLSVWSNTLLAGSLSTLFGSMNFSVIMRLQPDATVTLITFGVCLIATVLFSLGPALRAARVDLVSDLKQQAGEPGRTGRINRFFAPRHLLVMGQIALAFMLLFSSGLFLRGALKAGGIDLGFDASHGVVTEMDFTLGRDDETQAKRRMFAALQRVRQIPGAESAALATMVPFGNITNTRRVVPADAPPAADPNAGDAGASGLYTAITPEYFRAIGVSLLRGRDFTQEEAENRESPRVAIVDDAMAEKLFPGRDALGQRIRYTQAPADGSSAELEIVGIVTPHRHEVLDASMRRRLFVPLAQAYNGNVYLHVRFEQGGDAALGRHTGTLRRVLHELDPQLPILRLLPFPDLVERDVTLWVVRFGAVLFGVFGAIALLLAVVGVYGVKSYAVARRTREIGIRMAIGATRRDVFRLIMRQGILQTAFALAIGLLLSLGLGRILAQMLYQVSPLDPLSLLGASAILAAAALFACFVPARRAMRVTPITALRTE